MEKNYRQRLIEVLQAALDAVQSLQQVLLAQEEVLRFACDTRCLYARNHQQDPLNGPLKPEYLIAWLQLT